MKDTELAEGFSLHQLAEEADGLSGSDLRELCRNAAMRPMREFIRGASDDHETLSRSQDEVRRAVRPARMSANLSQGFKLRPLTLQDFFAPDETSPLPPVNPLDGVL